MKRRLAQLALAPVAVFTLVGVAAPAANAVSMSPVSKISQAKLKNACDANGGSSFSLGKGKNHTYGCTKTHDDGTSKNAVFANAAAPNGNASYWYKLAHFWCETVVANASNPCST